VDAEVRKSATTAWDAPSQRCIDPARAVSVRQNPPGVNLPTGTNLVAPSVLAAPRSARDLQRFNREFCNRRDRSRAASLFSFPPHVRSSTSCGSSFAAWVAARRRQQPCDPGPSGRPCPGQFCFLHYGKFFFLHQPRPDAASCFPLSRTDSVRRRGSKEWRHHDDSISVCPTKTNEHARLPTGQRRNLISSGPLSRGP